MSYDPTEVVLRVDNLRTYFPTSKGDAKAVDGVSFEIRRGEIFALVGESGCGKSMTALSVMKLVPGTGELKEGTKIEVCGRDIVPLSEQGMRTIRGSQISMIFQEPMTALNPVLTIGYQLDEAILLHQDKTRDEAKKISLDMIDRVKIPDPERVYKSYPHQLSGGMKQRVMIAMALSCRPDLLIADEPTTALDVTVQAQVLDLMSELCRDLGTGVLMITHDMGVVYENADHVGVMYAGKIVERGSRDQIFGKPSHPYTTRLLQSLPNINKRGEGLRSIPGIVPKAWEYPVGCRFSERCDQEMKGCRAVLPKHISVQGDHTAACHLLDPDWGGENAESLGKPPTPMSKGREPDPERLKGEVILEVTDLQKYYPIRKGIFKRHVGDVKAVDGISFKFYKGTTVALVGESGCGKTTAGKSLVQLLKPTGGSIKYKGEELIGASREKLRELRRNLQVIFQDPNSSLNPRMMIADVIGEGMTVHFPDWSMAKRREEAAKLLEIVGINPDFLDRYPHEFSGGQRQRIGIARALAVKPDFIVCDEVTSALDVSVQAQILNLLQELQESSDAVEQELTYLFITHDLQVVSYIADEVYVMYLGKIVEHGTTEEIFSNPRHPYTKALLSAAPEVDDVGRKKIRLEGDVPSPANPPKGCHFNPRCPHATDYCRSNYPGTYDFSDTHQARCWLYDDANGPSLSDVSDGGDDAEAS